MGMRRGALPSSHRAKRRAPSAKRRSEATMDIAELLISTIEMGASDLHLTVGLPPSVRVHGEIMPLPREPLTREQTHDLVYDIMNDAYKARFEATRDLDFSLDFGEAGRFR